MVKMTISHRTRCPQLAAALWVEWLSWGGHFIPEPWAPLQRAQGTAAGENPPDCAGRCSDGDTCPDFVENIPWSKKALEVLG
jgi:hypothetical protein